MQTNRCKKFDAMNRLRHLASASLITAMIALVNTAVAADRPNILFIMSDDQGYWDTGATGNPHIDTPSMDAIAAEGMTLDRYYAAPVCAPTRAGIMTGRYYLRTGLYNTRFGGDTLALDEVTVAQLLSQAGYRTGLFGKWHLGKYPGYQPQDRGFDQFFGHYHGHIERYEFPDQVYHNGRPVEARGYVSDLFTDASIDFMEQSAQQGKPFFCALMYNAPHSPWLLDTSHAAQPEGDKLLAKYLDRELPLREARIYALIERVDQNIGRLLAKLEAFGVAEDTVVIFSSDNVRYTFDGYDWDTIDGWKDPGERATWRLDVRTGGTYKLRLSYGCRPLDAGGVLRLQIGDEFIDHQIHATTTAEQFETFDAGLMNLSKGKAELVARVVTAPGIELMRLNKITLEPIGKR